MKTLNFLRYCVKAKLSHSLAQKTLHKQKKEQQPAVLKSGTPAQTRAKGKSFHFAESRKESHCKTRLVTDLSLSQRSGERTRDPSIDKQYYFLIFLGQGWVQ